MVLGERDMLRGGSDNTMNPFDQRYPEPLQGVVNHAERFTVALELAETDQSRDVATGPAELSLSETWVVGRATRTGREARG